MKSDGTLRDLSLLAARLVLGVSIAGHGAQKMFGAFGGPGIEKASQMMDSLGFDSPKRFARMASATEMASGTLISLGALGPVGPAMLLSVMLTAVETVHRPKGYWAGNGGYEMNTMYILLAMLLATEGYGSLSLDAALGIHEKNGATLGWLALAGGAVASMSVLSQRKQQPPQQSTHGETASSQPAMSSN